MKNLCTLSDYNYLEKGLVLYESLVRCSKDDFKLYYLCVDRKSYDKLIEIRLDKLVPIFVGDHKEFVNNHEDYPEYCWSLAARLSLYLFNNEGVEDVLYIDSDICFYHDLSVIYEEIGSKSIGIIPQRFGKYRESNNGKYNVGIVYFRNDTSGKKCLEFWNYCVTDPNNEYHEQYGTCGDQKYLELFEIKFPDDLCVIRNKVGWAAPWNFKFDFNEFSLSDRVIKFDGMSYPLVFVHFSKFVPNYSNNTYEDGTKQFGEDFYKPYAVKQIYNEYYHFNKKVSKKYTL